MPGSGDRTFERVSIAASFGSALRLLWFGSLTSGVTGTGYLETLDVDGVDASQRLPRELVIAQPRKLVLCHKGEKKIFSTVPKQNSVLSVSYHVTMTYS
jgi:hypothetical protein